MIYECYFVTCLTCDNFFYVPVVDVRIPGGVETFYVKKAECPFCGWEQPVLIKGESIRGN